MKPEIQKVIKDVWTDIAGNPPTPEEMERIVIRNKARVAIYLAMEELLGPGMSEEGKHEWMTSPSPFLGGRTPHEVANNGLTQVFDAIDQLQNGDFA